MEPAGDSPTVLAMRANERRHRAWTATALDPPSAHNSHPCPAVTRTAQHDREAALLPRSAAARPHHRDTASGKLYQGVVTAIEAAHDHRHRGENSYLGMICSEEILRPGKSETFASRGTTEMIAIGEDIPWLAQLADLRYRAFAIAVLFR